jgi:hypothetical protein
MEVDCLCLCLMQTNVHKWKESKRDCELHGGVSDEERPEEKEKLLCLVEKDAHIDKCIWLFECFLKR